MSERSKPTLWQRMALRQLRRRAGRADGEPLSPEDWEVVWRMHGTGLGGATAALFRRLPRGPRCVLCAAPFHGPGRLVAASLGYRPSRKNPSVCSTCIELSPPGGMTQWIGVLFADLRGYTAHSEGADPAETTRVLRRFYRRAEDVLFPEAVIDKLIGDEVMAIYLPDMKPGLSREQTAPTMLAHGRALVHGAELPIGIGLDVGEAFVGNIGQRALYDFTAVGDVVNTASRLQGTAAGGEIVLSDRVAELLPGGPAGDRVELELKGKSAPQVAYRLAG